LGPGGPGGPGSGPGEGGAGSGIGGDGIGSGVGEGGAGTSARVVVELMLPVVPARGAAEAGAVGIRGRSHDVQDDVKLDLFGLVVIRSQ
jgi:hypothetical protein